MMARSFHVQLLDQARHLASKERGRPLQVSLRRAVSTMYYALFHFLIDEATRSFIGSRPSQARLRQLLGRAFQHGTMSQASRAFGSGSISPRVSAAMSTSVVPARLQELANAFSALQELRQRADYDRSASFTREDVLALVARTHSMVGSWSSIRDHPSAKLYLLSLLTWDRLRDK